MANAWGLRDDCGICPRCRRVVPGGKPCDLDGSIARPIGTMEDKQALVDAIWGPPVKRTELMHRLTARTTTTKARIAAALTLGATCAVVMNALGVTSGAEALVAGILGTVFGVSVKSPKRILIPSGGTVIAPQPRFAAGEILPCEAVVAPGSGTECAAWALELRYDGRWGSRITLRVGASAGFDVALDGGERVRIPAGPLWFEGTLPQLDDMESHMLEEMLRTLDPTRTGDTETWPLFPFNIISEQTLQIGDRIEILGAVERELVSGQKDAMYRDAPASVLVPRASPALRLIAPR
jgi:hypothetical protein